ncbi:MAG: hypothetical protein JST61_00145 [Acidobacteria bacterium]|nr:hypothetical protein [Acidobacteriota bacterium]
MDDTRELPDGQMDLQTAKQIIAISPAHFNFGQNVQARRRYYKRLEQARRIVTEAGYAVKQEGFGYRILNKGLE